MPTISRVHTVLNGLGVAPAYSTLYFKDGDIGAVQASDAVKAFWTSIKNHIRTGIGIQVQPQIQQVDEATGEVVGVTDHAQASVSSTGTGDALPSQTQGLIRLNTGVWASGRQVIGHIYVPFMLEADNDGFGHMQTICRDDLRIACENMTDIPGNPTQVVYSRTQRRAFDVSSAFVPAEWSVLRSRRA